MKILIKLSTRKLVHNCISPELEMPCQPMATVLTLQGVCDCHIRLLFSECSTVSRKCPYPYQRYLVQVLSEDYELA